MIVIKNIKSTKNTRGHSIKPRRRKGTQRIVMPMINDVLFKNGFMADISIDGKNPLKKVFQTNGD